MYGMYPSIHSFLIAKETSVKGFSASKCDVGNWIFSKSKDFFEKSVGKFLDFVGEFFGEFFWTHHLELLE